MKLTMMDRSRYPAFEWGWGLVVVVLCLMLWGVAVPEVAVGQAAAPAAVVVPDTITRDQVNAVAREIWCPLCSGVRLDACELKACEQMKDVIAIKLAEGEDVESIKAYFVEQYGPQVMGEPPRSGFNWLAWILPVVAVVMGGVFFWRMTHRMVQPAAQSAVSVTQRSGASQEDYARKLEEELAKYG